MDRQQDTILKFLACPDCLCRLASHDTDMFVCPHCGRTFRREPILVLLPSELDPHKLAEERTWQEHDHEGQDKPAWMALIHKSNEIFYFVDKFAPNLSLKGKALELGAGSCWASSLLKRKFDDCYIVATDISPSALWKGKQISEILGATPDIFIACDTEHLPFAAESFDVIFGTATLHHLSNLEQGLKSIHQVLKPGGIYYGSSELASGKLFGAIWHSGLGLAGRRARQLGVNEKTYTCRQWQDMFEGSGFRDVHIAYSKEWQYKLYHWFPPLYYRMLGFLPEALLRYAACSINIKATRI